MLTCVGTPRKGMDDMNEVRQALGYEKINIAGESYGATVVQVYLNEHPETVRTATILRGTLLEYPIFEHFADSSQRLWIWFSHAVNRMNHARRLSQH